MDFAEINALIEAHEVRCIQLEDPKYTDISKQFKKKVGKFKCVVAFGGGEGEGEKCHRVFHFVDHDVYIRYDGWYASYDGSHYDNPPYEVRPREKTITVFE